MPQNKRGILEDCPVFWGQSSNKSILQDLLIVAV